MTSSADGQTTGPRLAASITIRHLNEWIETRHGPSFLGPLITGVLRRKGQTSKQAPVNSQCK